MHMQKKRPEPTVRTELLNLRVSPAEKRVAKGLAEKRGISVAMLVRQLIRAAEGADKAA
jgi:predicted HicB family RNase H-like nuclease